MTDSHSHTRPVTAVEVMEFRNATALVYFGTETVEHVTGIDSHLSLPR